MNDEILNLMGMDQQVHKLLASGGLSGTDAYVAEFARCVYLYAISLESRIEDLEERAEEKDDG